MRFVNFLTMPPFLWKYSKKSGMWSFGYYKDSIFKPLAAIHEDTIRNAVVPEVPMAILLANSINSVKMAVGMAQVREREQAIQQLQVVRRGGKG